VSLKERVHREPERKRTCFVSCCWCQCLRSGSKVSRLNHSRTEPGLILGKGKTHGEKKAARRERATTSVG